MMGRTHATSAAVAYLALQPVFASTGLVPVTAATVVLGTVASAGAGLLPDMDHEHATAAQSLGVVTKALTKVVSAISGGHRNGTHSLLGAAVFTGLAWSASRNPVGFAVAMGVLFALAVTGLRIVYAKCTPVQTIAVVVVTMGVLGLGWFGAGVASVSPMVLPVAVAVGVLAHIAGDMLTKEGCPLLYPLVKTRFHVVSITTGKFMERAVIAPALGVAAVALCLWQAHALSWLDAVDWERLIQLLN
ncbi:MAG: metal-dependent hydrolase [Propionibacteriaceae bacterium]|nr:metal-dependent hydrolase [Propionibacteriaceae bacterium]